MTPNPLLPDYEIEKDFLKCKYESTSCICRDYNIPKSTALERLLHDRSMAIENMKDERFSKQKIKMVLKLAADEEARHLAFVGISPEELY